MENKKKQLSTLDRWNLKYSEAEYKIKESEYKSKLSAAAKRNNLGGCNPNGYDLTCLQCGNKYNANVSNQLKCNECKELGVPYNCNYCNDIFHSKHKTKYCNICVENRVWNKGIKRPVEVVQRATSGKNRFNQTEQGRQLAKEIGRKNSISLKKFYKTEAGIAAKEKSRINNSIVMKSKIASGEFVPNITNSWTNWKSILILEDGTEKKFRSSWELIFWNSNRHLQYERFRIPYQLNGQSKTYIVDFYDDENNIVYEIKPKAHWIQQSYKTQPAINYCLDNNIKYIWINEDNFLSYVDTDDVTEINKEQLNKCLRGITQNKN